MEREDFIKLIGQDLVVKYKFGNEIQLWDMRNFIIENGIIKHKRLPLIIDVFIRGAYDPHKGIATHG